MLTALAVSSQWAMLADIVVEAVHDIGIFGLDGNR
jgi:hypothetical protein